MYTTFQVSCIKKLKIQIYSVTARVDELLHQGWLWLSPQ